MRPTFMGFETATRGLMAGQKALDIVGNNLTNIGVSGYTRQRVDLISLSVNMRYTRYNQNSTSFAGQGAAVYGVSQVRDKFLDKRFREEFADVGYYGVTSSVLEDLHNSLDEISPSTITKALSNFQTAWNDISLKTVTESVGAANLMAEATKIVQVFQQMSAKVDNVWNQTEYSLRQDVNNINSILERIAELNDTISKETFNSLDVANPNYKPLELLDQRNVLLDQLSEYADITYTEDDRGMVTVKMGGYEVLNGKDYDRLLINTDSETNPDFKTVSVFWNSSGDNVTFATGAVRASLDMLNGNGVNADNGTGQTFDRGILYYKSKIDEFARTLADAFNNVIEIVNPSTGEAYAPPQYKQLFSFSDDNRMGASTLIVSDAWRADTSYIITDVLEKIQDTGGKDDNSFAAKAYKLFEKQLDFGEFQGTFAEYISFYSNSRLNNDKSYADTCLDAAASVSDNLLNQIQQVSGVSMEEEGVDMLMYQKAYDAVSRVFTTLDEMLDKLINGTGVVGR